MDNHGVPVVSLILFAAWFVSPQGRAADGGQAINEGLQIYRRDCGACHGVNGQGYRGPDLTAGNWSAARTDGELARLIRQGLPSSGMPGTPLSDDESSKLIAFLRTLTGPARVDVGNAANGQKIFTGKGGCSRCHMVVGAGGRLGPDLTFVGATRSLAFLVRELNQPSEYVRRGFDPVTVVLPDGSRVRGALKNEDLFSVQMMTVGGDLRSYLRSEVREVIKESESLMPSYASGLLTAEETADLLKFLSTLGVAGTKAR